MELVFSSLDTALLYHMRIKSAPYEMFSCVCAFVDHASGFMIIKYQLYINSTESFKAKIIFERGNKSQGVVIKGYHVDNGVLNALGFM